MSATYDDILKARKLDMTRWLIHFTRNKDGLTGKQVFIKILAEGALRPGFAVREEKRTAYGEYPVVCFTEMTIAAFTHYVGARQEQNQMCEYGLFLPKTVVYEKGGRPVIYGLHSPDELKEGEDGYLAGSRILRDTDLPADEQYRYVAFDLTRTPYPIDWTHEREWRWRSRGSKDVLFLGDACDSDDSWKHVLPVPMVGLAGGMNISPHAFVEKDADRSGLAAEIQRVWDETPLDAESRERLPGGSKTYAEYWRDEGIKKVKVISLETARRKIAEGNTKYLRFDDWPDEDKPTIFE